MAHDQEKVLNIIKFIEFLEKDILKKIFKGKLLLFIQSSKEIREMLRDKNIEVAIRNKAGYILSCQELEDKLSMLKTWFSVSELQLIRCKLGYDGARAIAEALHINTTLKTIDLYNNDVGDDGARAFAKALRVNSTLHALALDYNDVGADGAMAIAESLRVNTTLRELYLWYNNVGDDGAIAVAEALRVNSTLHSLNFDYNYIGDGGARALCESWGNRVGTLRI